METKLKDSITDATVFYFIHGGATVLKKHSGVAYDVFQFRFHGHKRVDFKGLGGPSLPGPCPTYYLLTKQTFVIVLVWLQPVLPDQKSSIPPP